MEKILIVEDSEEIRGQLRWGLCREYEVLSAGNRVDALSIFRKNLPKVVTLDLGLPPDADGSSEGLHCLEEILRLEPATKVIVITGNEERESALRAVQNGAYDFYRKPFELGELKVILKRAFHLAAIERENSRLQVVVEEQSIGMWGIVGQSQGMLQVFSSIRKVASSGVAVMVTGESGTGKELVARAIHGLSMRKSGPFIPINCGAIPENLLEAELFGYEKGAFTGAHTRVQGKVEYAHKGTLFLDEIGELPLSLQVKFLRFLQEKSIQRVGGREDITLDARIVAATNLDIAKAIEGGTFREDLYYRLAVIHIYLPPLRERADDIMLLANLFLKRADEELGKKVRRFSSTSVRTLESYEWPGNVRELENRVQRAVIMSDSSVIEPEALGFTGKQLKEKVAQDGVMTLKDARDRTEREMVAAAIENKGNNMAKAAEILGISRPTLYDLIKKHALNKVI
jgi:two-component system NtrC family response regulator